MRWCLTALCARRGARANMPLGCSRLSARGVHVDTAVGTHKTTHVPWIWLVAFWHRYPCASTPVQLSFCIQVSVWNFPLVRSTLSRQDYAARWKRRQYGPTGASNPRDPEKYMTLTQPVFRLRKCSYTCADGEMHAALQLHSAAAAAVV